jgi:hypothetical protein
MLEATSVAGTCSAKRLENCWPPLAFQIRLSGHKRKAQDASNRESPNRGAHETCTKNEASFVTKTIESTRTDLLRILSGRKQ